MELSTEVSIWNKDFNNIYDYLTTDDITKSNTTVKSTTFIYKENNKVFFQNEIITKPSQDLIFLTQINIKNNLYELTHNKDTSSFKYSPWMVLSKTNMTRKGKKINRMKGGEEETDEVKKKHMYYLNEEDVFKLGKVMFRVISIYNLKSQSQSQMKKTGDEINKNILYNKLNQVNINDIVNNRDSLNNGNIPMMQGLFMNNNILNNQLLRNNVNEIQTNFNLPFIEENLNNLIDFQEEDSKKQVNLSFSSSNLMTCRICLIESSLVDPLICPCNCQGSVMYIHLSCIKKWVKSRQTVKEYKNLTVISFKSSKCEICKEDYPERLKINGNHIDLLEVDLPNNKNYILLEGFYWEVRETKNWYIIHMDNEDKKILFGRGNLCDVRMSCISVSREHAEIRQSEDGRFTIEDLNSKFGTLVLIKNKLRVIPYKRLTIQYNNCIISYKLMNSGWLTCCKKVINEGNVLSYNEMMRSFRECIVLERYITKEVKVWKEEEKKDQFKQKHKEKEEVIDLVRLAVGENISNNNNLNMIERKGYESNITETEEVKEDNSKVLMFNKGSLLNNIV